MRDINVRVGAFYSKFQLFLAFRICTAAHTFTKKRRRKRYAYTYIYNIFFLDNSVTKFNDFSSNVDYKKMRGYFEEKIQVTFRLYMNGGVPKDERRQMGPCPTKSMCTKLPLIRL